METSDRSTGRPSNPLTSCAAATRASPSVTRDRVRASLTRAIFGQRLPDACAIYDPVGSCWRTSQATFLSGLDLFSETWPRSGTMRGGTASQLRPSAPRTYATACSLWRGELLPTKTASPYGSSNNGSNAGHPCSGKGSLETMAARGLLPTPTVSTRSKPRAPKQTNTKVQIHLADALIPHGQSGHPCSGKGSLETMAARGLLGLIPTPTASMHKCATIYPSNVKRYHEKQLHTEGAIGALGYRGRLHPRFVEWMMGFPVDWTRLDCAD